MIYRLPIWVMPHSEGLAFGYAILKGGTEERIVGFGESLILAVQIVLIPRILTPIHGDALLGPLDLGFLLTVALRSEKFWPMAYCSVSLVSAMTLVTATFFPIDRWAYGTAMFVWNYLQCLIVVVATWRTSRAAKRAAIAADERLNVAPLGP